MAPRGRDTNLNTGSFVCVDALHLQSTINVSVLVHLPGLNYSETCVKRPLSKRQKISLQDQYYCRMLEREHSAILWTFIKLPFVIKIFVLSIFEWLFYTSFTVVLRN